VRHRTAPILVVERDESGAVKGYKITMAPAVSGQSIAYGYMKALVELAPKYELRVCDDCRNYQQIGGFFKRAGNTELGHDERIKECVVEDLTGFMATKEKGGQERGRMLRRTSPVMFSYMVPDSVSARGVVVPELHVRYNLQDPEQQVPYQIEAGTAIYIHSVAIDVDRIGRLEAGDNTYVENRAKRVELAFDALKTLYGGLLFGAKKARYLPIIETLGAIAGVADPLPFNVTPPRFGDYVAENLLRAKSYNVSNVKLFCFDKEGITSCKRAEGVDASDSLEALIDKVKEAVMEKIGAVEK
ncbi:MAG: DevR family CRISPR-associated autoregulator, partial [Infirmifilum sp.]|uniref:DevR family CRISPR-associated autoregulator n=1 Tax=Infirmifilum sp. TaxID=2856575 RepID=UPI003D12EE85